MARFADDVRKQEARFVSAVADAVQDAFRKEYRRLRASALESGDSVATLQASIRCNFDPKSRSIAVTTAIIPLQPQPRRKVVAIDGD